MQGLKYILHLLCFYLIWFACVLGAAKGWPWFGPGIGVVLLSIQYLFQRWYIKDYDHLMMMMLSLLVVGTIIDSLLLYFGLINYIHNPFAPYCSPPWMMMLWLNFAMVYYSLLQSLWSRYVLLAVLCLLGFPLAYISGDLLGAATLSYGPYSSILVGIVWAVLLPSISIYFQGRKQKHV